MAERPVGVDPVGVGGVPSRRRLRDHRDPFRRSEFFVRRATVQPGRLDRDLRRVVAGEERGVHDDLVQDAGNAQRHHGPVIAGSTAASRLPAVVDLAVRAEFQLVVHGRPRLDQRFARREELVADEPDGAAERPRSQIQVGALHLRVRSFAGGVRPRCYRRGDPAHLRTAPPGRGSPPGGSAVRPAVRARRGAAARPPCRPAVRCRAASGSAPHRAAPGRGRASPGACA